MQINQVEETSAGDLSTEGNAEGTSTLAIAEELHRSSWKNNPGKTIYDLPMFRSESPVAQAFLLDVACAAEAVLYFYDQEEQQLLTWNVADAVYTAYHKHPFSTVPDLPWVTAPNDVKRLWYEYAKDVVRVWYMTKHLPQMVPWLNIEIDKNG